LGTPANQIVPADSTKMSELSQSEQIERQHKKILCLPAGYRAGGSVGEVSDA
jgi:hypothetical protein